MALRCPQPLPERSVAAGGVEGSAAAGGALLVSQNYDYCNRQRDFLTVAPHGFPPSRPSSLSIGLALESGAYLSRDLPLWRRLISLARQELLKGLS